MAASGMHNLHLVFGTMSILWGLNNIQTARAANPPGFLYIDCGSTAAYNDSVTGIQWVPDDGYITTGVNVGSVIPANKVSAFPELTTLRFFNGSQPKDCYSLPVTKNSKYWLRASFLYGNYDNSATAPTFYMAIDATVVANISTTYLNGPAGGKSSYEEFTIVAQSNVTYLCLVRDASNTNPFISAISLRPAVSYDYGWDDILAANRYLSHLARLNLGGLTDDVIRYPDDIYDRYWFPKHVVNTYVNGTAKLTNLSTTNIVDTSGTNQSIPSSVMQTCLAMSARGNMTFYFPLQQTWTYAYLQLYWAELDQNVNRSSRQFKVQVPQFSSDSYVDVYNDSNGLYSYLEESWWYFILTPQTSKIVQYSTPTSVYGPILNAVELFAITDVISSTTIDVDVSAIDIIKSSMNLEQWSGDPCLPTSHSWLTCENTDSSPDILAVNLSGYDLNSTISFGFAQLLNLTSLDLSNCGLSGSLPNLSALTSLNKLHLANNSLTGVLPDWLASLPKLTELFVENNNFNGSIPDKLLSKSGNGLDFRYTGNPGLKLGNTSTTVSQSSSPSSKHQHVGVIVGVVVGGIAALAILIVLVIYFIFYRSRQSDQNVLHPTLGGVMAPSFPKGGAQVYSYQEVVTATENFKKEIGRGGFGPVYYGKLDNGQEVAIKVLDIASRQGSTEFFNEVDLLSRVHHKNLVALVGYCVDNNQQMLIYEYISHGSLFDHLHGPYASNSQCLDWKMRLNIALNAAQGLDYLHTGCNPSMIHRDVKSSNILLTGKADYAKVCDFGLSKLVGDEGASHVLTFVKGTAGYVDPEYFSTQRLSLKSDVFGFGVVLLELVTGRPPVNATDINQHEPNLSEWVRNSVESGNIEAILDHVVQTSNTTLDAAWKVVDVALRSVEPKSVHRPTMAEVVDELRQAVVMANALPSHPQKTSHNNTPSNLSNFSSDSHVESQNDMIPPR